MWSNSSWLILYWIESASRGHLHHTLSNVFIDIQNGNGVHIPQQNLSCRHVNSAEGHWKNARGIRHQWDVFSATKSNSHTSEGHVLALITHLLSMWAKLRE